MDREHATRAEGPSGRAATEPGRDFASPATAQHEERYAKVNPEVARKIRGPGMSIDQFCHQVKLRREEIQTARGIGTQRNKDVFLRDLNICMGQLAETYLHYRDQLLPGHQAAVYWLVNLAAEASLMAEWDARAGGGK